MRTSVLFGVKNFGFFKIYCVSARTRGGREVNFSRFCVDVLYGRPLRKLPCVSESNCLDRSIISQLWEEKLLEHFHIVFSVTSVVLLASLQKNKGL